MSKQIFTTHTGMVDILPDESHKWQFIESVVRDTARLFFFQEIRTPILEQTELIARGVGQLTDIVSKEMFAFSRGDDNYVLRPEGTAPVARSFIENNLDQRGGTQRLFYIGPMFRAERPQKGRQRQFHQFGAEVIGSAHPMADAEIIAFMLHVYQKIGITNTTLKINSVGDPESRTAYKTALQNYFRPVLSQLSDISQQRFETNPLRILDSKEEEDQAFITDAPSIHDYLNQECRTHFAEVLALLDLMDINYTVDHRLVRGLDYYTKTAFELVSPDLGSQDALGGGGRYDLLIEEIGGRPTPAIGFASGFERLLIACEALNLFIPEALKPDVYIVCRGDEAQKWAMKTKQHFMKLGVSCTLELSGKSLKAQMKDADRTNAKFTLIIGEEELNSGLLTLRDMGKSNEQKLTIDDVIKAITPN